MRRKHNRITNYYKDKAGNEIIETQTYYSQPENDWEFDEDQKLSYNNPVFIELCKRRGKNFDELNTGWVPQHKLGEAENESDDDEDEIEEYEDNIDDELDEDELFKSPTKSDRHHEAHSKRPAPSSKDDDELEEVSFKFGEKNDTASDKPPKVDTPDLGLNGLEDLFGPSSSPIVLDSTTSTRDKVANALQGAPDHAKQNIKLNIDKTTADQPMAPKPNVIKLNIKQKPQQ